MFKISLPDISFEVQLNPFSDLFDRLNWGLGYNGHSSVDGGGTQA